MLIFSHIGVLSDHYIMYYFYFPIFLVISGFFFPLGLERMQFIKNRVTKILYPFLFFYVISYILFYIGMSIAPEIMQTEACSITDVFTQRQWFNGPIWYLLCLFWLNLWLYVISKVSDKILVQIICVLIVGYIGSYLGKRYFFLPMMIDASFSALPFFYLGYILKSSWIFYPNRYDKYGMIIGALLLSIVLVLVCFFPDNWIGFHTNTIIGNYFVSLFISSIAVISVIYLCKSIRTLPFLTFFGMYSIVPFSVHHLIYRPLIVMFSLTGMDNVLIPVAILTVVVSALLIPVFKNYFPWAIGLKKRM